MSIIHIYSNKIFIFTHHQWSIHTHHKPPQPPSLSTITPKPTDQTKNPKLIKQKKLKRIKGEWDHIYEWVSEIVLASELRWWLTAARRKQRWHGLLLRSSMAMLQFAHQWQHWTDRWAWGWTNWWSVRVRLDWSVDWGTRDKTRERWQWEAENERVRWRREKKM